MTADLSPQCIDLYRMFGVIPHPDVKTVRIDLGERELTEEEMIAYLKDGIVPADPTTPSLEDKPLAMGDS